MDQSKSLEENLNEFKKIVVDLNNIDEKMSDENQGYDSVEALMVSHRDIQNAWIMDFGCTYHITPNRDFLINFQKSDGGKVLLGDNGTYEVKGSDSVLIATHDGMSRMLTNVRYVPELKRNLISLGELNRSGYTIKFENGIMKVTKGSLVKLRGTLRNGLYVLEGTVVSEATEQSEFDGVQFQQESSLIDEGVYNDIITSDSKKQRKDAMEAELFILRKNHTWSLVTKPLIQKLIQQKWFKQGGDNKPRYKVRLVAKVLPAHSDGALRQVGFNGVFSVSSRRASTALGFRRAWVPLYGSSVVGYLACSRYFTRGSLERRRVSGGF
ncbi:Retrovirus-related Pol polyprotein from transposon TNT 1-94 [Cucumis melo var. makuwa]|uniref:Retrovirus-related Pol polyprotein from transposon TNT 1-94 n=1 Tax=Cucumis melo var. makuwa TaxID=1194695 RepID=A0A5A7V031_CUCMM|nr:Retrovirus-related Pol polyprotein from transposon TNT 1-94 [Cucumis melo var. makuwa]